MKRIVFNQHRQPADSDVPELLLLIHELDLEMHPMLCRLYNKELKPLLPYTSIGPFIAKDNYLAVIYADDKAVAFCWYTSQDICIIHSLYVAPDYRSLGLGKNLINSAFDIAYERQGPNAVVELDVLDNNDQALAFYNKMAFTPITKTLRITVPRSNQGN
jgi:ribosomal protein S18 acetylase RimI-like enzyme